MGTRGWTLSTFVGCCIWILHGLGAVTAVPVTTEGPSAEGTASPITAETEGLQALVMATAETSAATADAEIAESILAGSPVSPSLTPGAEPTVLVTAVSDNGSTVPTLTNVTKPLNSSQDNERSSAALAAATTAAAISTQHPAVTPETEPDVTGATPDAPLGINPLFADVKEDVLPATTREGAEDLDPTVGDVSLPTTPLPPATWGAQPTAGSPMGASVTVLLSQGLTTAMGAVKEDITLPVDIQSEASAKSSSPSPGTGELLMTQSDTNPPALATILRTGDVEAVGLAEPSLQPAPWQSLTGEQPPLLAAALPSPTDTSSASGVAYPPPGAEAGTLPAADDGAETPVSSDLAATPGAPVSPSLGELQPWETAAGAPQGGDGPSTGLNSALDALNPTSFVPGGLAWPAAGVLAQGGKDAGETAQAGGPSDGSPYADTQTDISPSAFSTQQNPTNTEELPGGGVGALANAEQSPPSALGDGAGAAPALGQVSPPGAAPPGSAGLDPDLSGAEGPGNLLSESASSPGAANPPLGAAAGPVSAADTPVSPDLGAAQGAPVPLSLGESQPWGISGGAPQGSDVPEASGPDTGLNSAWDGPISASYGPVGAPSPALGDQLGTNLGVPGEEGLGASTTEPVLGGAGSGSGYESTLMPAAMAAGMDQLPGTGSSSGPAPPNDLVAASSISRGDGAGPIPAAAPGPDSLSPASPDSETGLELTPVQGTESAGDAAQAGKPESESPYMEMSPSAFSTQQDPTNTEELLGGGVGALANAEQSPPSALGDGAGAAPALGQVSPPGAAPPGSAGLDPDLSGAEGPGNLLSESASSPGAANPPLGAAAGPVSAADTPVSPDLGAAQGAPVPLSLGESQPWGTSGGAPQGSDVPEASGPDTGLNSAWDGPISASYGPVGAPSPALGDQLGTNLGVPAVAGHGAGTTEPVLGGAGSASGFEPPLSSAAGSGMAAGMDQLHSAGSLSSPASPSVVAASSISDVASPSALGGVGGAPGAPQPSLGAGPGVSTAVGEEAGEAAGDGGSQGQSQAPARGGPAGSGAPDGEMGSVLQSASSSPSMEASSSTGMAGNAANGANLPGADGASDGLSTALQAAGPKEPPMSAPGIQSGTNLGLSDAKLSQVNVVELPGGASVNAGSSPGASLGEGTGAIIQIASGALAPSALTSPQETQPLVPVAADSSSTSDGTSTSLAASLLLPGHGLSLGLAPNGDPHSAPSTQSGSRPLLPGAPGGLAGDAGGAQMWSLEDEVASGMPAPLGEVSPRAPMPLNAAPALPSAPQRENAAEGVSASPGLSAPLSACESVAGSSAGGRGELGAAALGGPALLLPPPEPGSPRAPAGDAASPMPREVSAVLPRAMTGRGDIAQLLPSATGAREGVETSAHSLLGGTPGLPDLPPTGIAAGSPGSKTLGPESAGGSLPAALQPSLGGELTTSLANRAPVASGSSLPTAFPGQGGAQGRSPATVRPAVSCSPATISPALTAPLPRGREVLPRPGAATVTSRASSPVFPALPGGPVAAPTPLPGPSVPAVPLYGYGARENDREYVERRVDFNSPLFKPETGFPFGKTLRDSLYFTDNGQIIFPASDSSIFTYPNPPPGGFNGHEEVPMIAVFWDNADFSRGVGTTFYQEFRTLNTAKPPFVRDVEEKVRRYLRSSYSAAWTLKITWEKAPAYAARTDTRRTSTYQAILTTDGFRSYVLMLYQEGGMGWDYTRRTATNVLIGYTSGDGFYRNDDLTQRPPAAKYRPDQFRGYNTDLRGLWIYKLESRVGVNYRLKCLAWTGRQLEPRAWSQGLPTCPCSLQQGQQDPRFKSSRRGWWAARVSMLHSASPNQHGAGIRCLYDSQNQLIEGRQERYWRSSRQASPYRDQELKLHDWCCNQAGSARLCALYSEKRPKIGCDGYQSPSMAGSSEEAESDSEEQRDEDDK